jgi:hypothetical protein
VARNTSTAIAEKVTRPRKSAAEKAQATLDQAQKRHDKALAKREKITAELAAIGDGIAASPVRVDARCPDDIVNCRIADVAGDTERRIVGDVVVATDNSPMYIDVTPAGTVYVALEPAFCQADGCIAAVPGVMFAVERTSVPSSRYSAAWYNVTAVPDVMACVVVASSGSYGTAFNP